MKYEGPGGWYGSSPSWGGFFIGANGGGRYWFSESLGVTARIGLGTLSYSALDVGVDFKF